MQNKHFCLVGLVGLVVASGCNAVLGIETAELDPALGSAGAGAPGAAGAAGSSAGSAGQPGVAGQGGATGGTPCDRYCDDAATFCKQDNAIYTSRSVCMRMCANFEPGVDGETDKDSLACRAYHVKAAKDNPAIHCRHAGVLGGGVCGNEPCTAFCLQAFALCPGATLGYASEAECLSACKGKMQYLSGDGDGDLEYTGGDSLNCRLYHLESAANPDSPTAKATHCPHTQAASTVCFNEGKGGASGTAGAGGAGTAAAGGWGGAASAGSGGAAAWAGASGSAGSAG